MSLTDGQGGFVPTAKWADDLARQSLQRGLERSKYIPPRVPEGPAEGHGASNYFAYEVAERQDADEPGNQLPSANPMSPAGREKVGKVMGEYKRGTLHSGSDRKVTDPAQAKAIALSEARRAGARIPKRR